MGTSFAVDVDEHTVARARKGDLEALEMLYRTFSTPVYTLAVRLLGRRQDAEEVLQETFIEVMRSIRSFRGDGPLWAWIRRIAASKALMRLRSERARPAGQPIDAVEVHPATITHPAPVGDRLDLGAALARLSDTARAVVWLHDVEGYTHEEIAAAWGRTPSFSKSQLARAHDRLRELLSSEEEARACT